MFNTATKLLFGSDTPYQSSTDFTSLPLATLFKVVGDLAYHAMLVEVYLTPKPGLVDSQSNGSHRDMDIHTFERSANAIRPFLPQFVQQGWRLSKSNASTLLGAIRPVGINCEQAMFNATNGVNTHKGMIFSLGLVCCSVGWLRGQQQPLTANNISDTIAAACSGIVTKELKPNIKSPQTAGEKIYVKYGLTGARGEAESGFTTVMKYGLPTYIKCINLNQSNEQALWQTLLTIMANNPDTNLVSRGGLEGLYYVQQYAQRLISHSNSMVPNIEQLLIEFDNQLIRRNLSPGGSADLLAITWLMAQLENMQHIDLY